MYHYRCIGNIFVRGQVRCAANGSVGREDELVDRHGGVAAFGARGRRRSGGHGERRASPRCGATRSRWSTPRPRLGGRWAYAAATSAVNADLLRWSSTSSRCRGVDRARSVSSIDVDAVLASGADAVVVATGARWGRPRSPGADLPHVHAVDDLGGWLFGDEAAGQTTSSCSAETFPGSASPSAPPPTGARVTVLEPSDVFGLHLGLPGRWRRVHDLRAHGIVLAGRRRRARDHARRRAVARPRRRPRDRSERGLRTLDADARHRARRRARARGCRRHRGRRRRRRCRAARARHATALETAVAL